MEQQVVRQGKGLRLQAWGGGQATHCRQRGGVGAGGLQQRSCQEEKLHAVLHIQGAGTSIDACRQRGR